jgi:HEAT repeat protein
MNYKTTIRSISLSIILLGASSAGCSQTDYAIRDRYYHRAEKGAEQFRTRLTSPNINDRQTLNSDILNSELPAELTIGELYPRLLNDPNIRIRGNTLSLIGSISNSQGSLGGEAAPLLNYALQDPNPRVRKLAAQVSLSGDFSKELVRPELIRRLADPNEQVRRASIYSLVGGAYQLEEKPIDEESLLQDSRPEARESLAMLLRYRQSLDDSELSKLLKLTQDAEPKVRSKAIWTLAKWIKKQPSKNPKIIPSLLPFLTDTDPSIRMSTAYALGQSGKSAVKAIPNLVLLLKDKNSLVRSYAVEALGNIGSSQEIKPHLDPLLNDSSRLVQELTTKALQKDKK